MKGRKTYIAAALVILASLGAALADPQVIAAHPQAVGTAGVVVGVLMAVLRKVTEAQSREG